MERSTIVEKLEKIIEKARAEEGNIITIIKDLEIYIIQNECIALTEEHENYTRVLPKDSMNFIDIDKDTFNIIDERNYIVFKSLYKRDLLKYIEKMWIHKGTVRLHIRNNYSLKDIIKTFNEFANDIFKEIDEKIDVFSGDLYNYFEFYDNSKEEYIIE